MALDRQLPQNIEAEQSVLGSLLIDPDAILAVAPFLHEDDFFSVVHRKVYAAMQSLHERRQPADIVTTADELERRGDLEAIGGAAYLTTLINFVPTSVHVENYAHIVERTGHPAPPD